MKLKFTKGPFEFGKDIEEPVVRRISKGYVSEKIEHGCIKVATYEGVVGLCNGVVKHDIENPTRDCWHLFQFKTSDNKYPPVWYVLIYDGEKLFYPIYGRGGKQMICSSWKGLGIHQLTVSDKKHLDFMLSKILSG